jgi:DNA mismatch endonuclease (patch repair protein)
MGWAVAGETAVDKGKHCNRRWTLVRWQARQRKIFWVSKLRKNWTRRWDDAISVCMDTRSPEQRRRIMQSVGSKNTGPELTVRRLLHAMGYRFRLYRADLPGHPDIVLPRRRKAIFVHGCFWHAHDCSKGRSPKSRLEYWLPKLAKNAFRDRTKMEQLESLGWSAIVVWQCETGDLRALSTRLRAFVEE